MSLTAFAILTRSGPHAFQTQSNCYLLVVGWQCPLHGLNLQLVHETLWVAGALLDSKLEGLLLIVHQTQRVLNHTAYREIQSHMQSKKLSYAQGPNFIDGQWAKSLAQEIIPWARSSEQTLVGQRNASTRHTSFSSRATDFAWCFARCSSIQLGPSVF